VDRARERRIGQISWRSGEVELLIDGTRCERRRLALVEVAKGLLVALPQKVASAR